MHCTELQWNAMLCTMQVLPFEEFMGLFLSTNSLSDNNATLNFHPTDQHGQKNHQKNHQSPVISQVITSSQVISLFICG
jgi:hypothetical protein